MAEPLHLFSDSLATPIGELILIADAQGRLRATDWSDHHDRLQRTLRLQFGRQGVALQPRRDPRGLSTALRAYFAGDLRAIDALPVEMDGTAFQRTVWHALRQIPCSS